MKLLNLKRILLPIIFIGSLMTTNGQVTQKIDNSNQLKHHSSSGRDYAEVVLLVSTNTGESPQGAIATLDQLDGDSIYTDTVPADGMLTFPQVWNGEYQLTVTKEGYETYNNVVLIQEEYFIQEILLIEELIPPENLEAETNCKDVYLDWTHGSRFKNSRSENRKIPTQSGNNSRKTKQREFLGFNVYKEGVLLNEEPLSETEYTDENSLGGTYGYFVTAVYSTGESETTDTVSVEVDFITPPQNLEGHKINWIEIQLEWDEPLPQQYYPLQWDDGENYTSIGTEDEYDFSVASRWYPEDLGDYDSMYLDKISFYPTEENCEYYARVWTGSEATLVIDQHIPQEQIYFDTWNTIELDTEIQVNADQDLWFGYRANAEEGYPAGVDEGPANPYHGDMIWDAEEGWQSLLEDYELDHNWNIAGILLNQEGEQVMLSEKPETSTSVKQGTIGRGPINPHPESINFDSLDVVSYNIYRDNELLEGSWPFTTYVDDSIDLQTQDYLYYVTAEYSNGCISVPSNEELVTVYINSDEKEKTDKKIQIHPNPAKEKIHLITKNKMESITIYNTAGDRVYQDNIFSKTHITLNVTKYKSGLYIARFKTKNGKHISTSFVVTE